MARFSNSSNARSNSKNAVATRVVKNNAGGSAYKQSDKLELVNLMLSNFLAGDMYRSEKSIQKRIEKLVADIGDKEFVAKAALYARNEFGMRTMSHLVAGEMANQNSTSGMAWAKDFYNAIVYRADDMSEIMGYYFGQNPDASLPNAMKKGFANAIGRFDAYQLAKYRGENKAVKLVDVVRLVRPRPNKRNAEALKALLEGNLKNQNTWEAKVSKAGQSGTAKEKAEARQKAWGDLLLENKLGYLALIRNLVNIANDVDDATFEVALKRVQDTGSIKKSKIFPFQIYNAFVEIDDSPRRSMWGYSGQASRVNDKRRIAKLVDALAVAIDASLANIPELDGKSLIAIDVSGSMSSRLSDKNSMSYVDIAALFGVALAKATKADVMTFDGTAKYISVPTSRSTVDIVKGIATPGGATNFEDIFKKAGKTQYDRVFILSDMQAWVQNYYGTHPRGALDAYKTRSGANPYVYSFDLAGHGTMQVPENDGKVIALAGWSDKIFDILSVTEQDREALINTISEYPIQVMRKVKK